MRDGVAAKRTSGSGGKKSATANKKAAARSKSGGRKLVVIDGANAMFRAFFGIPGLRAPDGTPSNAVLGFANILNKIIRDEAPDYVAVALDPKGGSFRKELYSEYKANRDATPEDLSAQIPLIRELIDAHNIPCIEVPGFEADDVIATLVARAPEDTRVSIISTDKDLMQLCSDRVELLDGIKERRFGPEEVEEKFGVPPEQMLDLRALVGDPSDNIPGVKGIGVKGAAKLIEEWGTLENLLEHAGEVKAKRAREALLESPDDARLSKELSTLRDDVDLGVKLDTLVLAAPDVEVLRALYKRLGFTRLVESLDPAEGAATQEAGPEAAEPIEIVTNLADLEAAIERFSKADGLVVMEVEGRGSAVDALIVGVAIASDSGDDAIYLPVTTQRSAQADLPLDSSPLQVLEIEVVVEAVTELFSQKPWFGWHTKRVQSLFAEHGFELPTPGFDARIGALLLDPAGSHDLPPLAMQYLGREIRSWEEFAGRGAKAIPGQDLPVAGVANWVAQQIAGVCALRAKIHERLDRDGLLDLFEKVELPLTRVLSRIERNGVRIDQSKLAELSVEYETSLAAIEKEIYGLAGEEFKVGSPKQLQVILFEKLRLTPLKRTKTGYSTAEDVLEQLASEHELPGKVLRWRQLSKLKSTYIDALPKLVSVRTGRIHPNFNQIGAATGRLSASDPNVQNIPIRTAEGVRIRETFVPARGRVLLSADYSQVELRVLAHYSGDQSLVDAFSKGEDIHRRTAAEVAGISVDEVDNDQRARAKAVNFGIIYGSSAFGLANNLGIATSEAQDIVDAYFARYTGVRRFLDETVKDAKATGFVTTILGRRRYLPDLSSKNRVLRQAAERMAVNTVIQGTAADLIKKAMVEVDIALEASDLEVIVILQVHDELVFEVPKKQIEELSDLVRERMENVFQLRVPLVVDIGYGKNWRDAH
ncbi:MAG: DNA polymerase I [bacterium]|nr:DNA polymerase I [bacterium]